MWLSRPEQLAGTGMEWHDLPPCDHLSAGVFSDGRLQAAGQQMIRRKRMEDSGRENCPVLKLLNKPGILLFYAVKTTSPGGEENLGRR